MPTRKERVTKAKGQAINGDAAAPLWQIALLLAEPLDPRTGAVPVQGGSTATVTVAAEGAGSKATTSQEKT